MTPLEKQLQIMVEESQTVMPKGINGLGGKPAFRKRKSKYKKKSKKASFTKIVKKIA